MRAKAADRGLGAGAASASATTATARASAGSVANTRPEAIRRTRRFGSSTNHRNSCGRSCTFSLSVAAPGELKFGSGDGFYVELRRRVEAYFRATGQGPRDRPQMYLKTAVVFAWLAASYGLLVFSAATWWLAELVGKPAGTAPHPRRHPFDSE